MRDYIYRGLKWSEKYTKADMAYLAKGGFWLSLGQGTGTVLTLILAIGFANLLSPETYGTYKFVLSIAGIISAFSLTGMVSALTRLTAKEGPGALRAAFKINLLYSTIPFTLTLIGSLYYFYKDNFTLGTALLFALLSPLIASFSLALPFFIGLHRFDLNTKFDVLRNIFATLVMLGTIFLSDSAITIIAVYFIAQATLTGIMFWYAKRYDINPIDISKTNLREYSIHLSIMNIIRRIANHADSILLFHFLGPVALAVYSFALAPTKEMHRLSDVIKSLIAPKLAVRSISSLRISLPYKAFLLFLGFGVLAGVYSIAAPYLFEFIFPQYKEAVALSQWSSLVLLSLPFIIFSETLVAHAKTRVLYIQQVSIPLLRIVLLLILLPLYGLWGAIAAYLIPRFANAVLVTFSFYFIKD